MLIRIMLALLALALLQHCLWFGHGGLPEVHSLAAQKAWQQRENAALEERNAALAAEVIDLKEGLAAIEEIARGEMGMIKEGETFYQIIDSAGYPALAE